MGPILPAVKRNKPSELGQLLSGALGTYFQNERAERAAQQENTALKKLGIEAEGLSGETRKNLLPTLLKEAGRKEREESNRNLIEKFYSANKERGLGEELKKGEELFPDELIAQVSVQNPQLARLMQDQNSMKSREKIADKKEENRRFETERAFHTGYSKEQVKEADNLRSTIPKKEMALNFAREAVEMGDPNFFSLDKLADATGFDIFRTAKGVQLITAGKENLLTNLSRVSARAQNQWMEQRIASMFPKIGQSNEANLTAQEMIEAELALDKAYLNAFERISEEDEKDYGFERKDASKRAHKAIEPLQKEIMQRASYRLKELDEQEKGLTTLKTEVGKKVAKGTPLTLAMAKLYRDKFGKEAVKVAEKNGYYIPSLEEFKIFQSRPQEYREQL